MCNIVTLVKIFTFCVRLTLFKPQIFNSANLFWKNILLSFMNVEFCPKNLISVTLNEVK